MPVEKDVFRSDLMKTTLAVLSVPVKGATAFASVESASILGHSGVFEDRSIIRIKVGLDLSDRSYYQESRCAVTISALGPTESTLVSSMASCHCKGGL